MTSPACRLCGDRLDHLFIDLGAIPNPHALLTPQARAERRHPLRLRVCDRCLLVQRDATAEEAANPSLGLLTQPATLALTTRQAAALIDRFRLVADSLIMEVASGAGAGLRPFLDSGLRVLGIEPDKALAAQARALDIPTEMASLNAETAMAIAATHGRADFVMAHQVLAEASDLFSFAAGFAGILRPNGIAVFEFSHLLWLTEQVRFDCIDHGHRSFLSLLVAERILRSVGLVIFDLERLPPPGGILRVFAGHVRGPYPQRPSVKTMRLREVAAGLDHPAGYNGFAPAVAASISTMREFIMSRRQTGRRIAAYGVTAEAATLLNLCEITHQDIICVADPDATKHGLLLPGSLIPILPPDLLAAFRPDDVLVFPPDGPLESAMGMAALLPNATCFWTLAPVPRSITLRSQAA